MSYAQDMKARIIADLQELIPTVLQLVVSDDMAKTHPLDRDLSKLPAAIVIPPSILTSEYEDQSNNVRDYLWYIMIVCTPEAVAGPENTYLEGLMDAILNKFDLDCTLGGTSIAAVQPAVVESPGPTSFGEASYVTFYVTLKARQLVPAAVSETPA